MRPELREITSYPETVGVYDLQATVELCCEIAQSHWSATHLPFVDADLTDHPTIEALADRNFETAYQVQFIFQFGLWRMQALFEVLLEQRFPEFRKMPLARRLSVLDQMGLISATDRAELLEWIHLRNELSHRPPRAPSLFHQVERNDLIEFSELVHRIVERATLPRKRDIPRPKTPELSKTVTVTDPKLPPQIQDDPSN